MQLTKQKSLKPSPSSTLYRKGQLTRPKDFSASKLTRAMCKVRLMLSCVCLPFINPVWSSCIKMGQKNVNPSRDSGCKQFVIYVQNINWTHSSPYFYLLWKLLISPPHSMKAAMWASVFYFSIILIYIIFSNLVIDGLV